MDVSGTQANISNLKIENITDKGLSIGENSQVQAENISHGYCRNRCGEQGPVKRKY